MTDADQRNWNDTAEIDRLRGENARLLSDPMNVGWQRAQDAIKDRAAAVSQWKAAMKRIAALEAERDALKQDAERWRCIKGMLWWRTDPFAQDVGNMGTGYWQTKLFKQVVGKPDLDAAIDAAREKP